jgi:hypothetical protein
MISMLVAVTLTGQSMLAVAGGGKRRRAEHLMNATNNAMQSSNFHVVLFKGYALRINASIARADMFT